MCTGLGNRALELMALRSVQRVAFGKHLARQGAFQKEYATRKIELDAARLVVLDAAHHLDMHGNKKVCGLTCFCNCPCPVFLRVPACVLYHPFVDFQPWLQQQALPLDPSFVVAKCSRSCANPYLSL
jgi:alkylation response protein AidB-like acyl-CoA dehydrogenase